ncbi:MAG: (Fe-S)-binding protein [Opitutaceae bacterium]|jgi:L-lactate dehydrogenase complex protein LldE
MTAIDRVLPGPNRQVKLMATCLCDAFFDDVAKSTVEVLEHLGCKIDFPECQTCCGQPAFNSGDWASSRRVLRHAVSAFAGDEPVVMPSSSCAAMLFHGSHLAFEKEADLPQVALLGRRTWELADFIVNALGVSTWPGRFDAAIAFHRSCHTRGSKSAEAAAQLMSSIPGIKLVEFGEKEQCCGFGGTFSVTFPNVSKAMGTLKLEHLEASHPDLIVSLDSSCLMHLEGLAKKAGKPIKSMHLAQVLRQSLVNGGLIAP